MGASRVITQLRVSIWSWRLRKMVTRARIPIMTTSPFRMPAPRVPSMMRRKP